MAQLGYEPEHLAKLPKLEADLFSGRQTELTNVFIAPDVKMSGRLRIVLGAEGPEIRFTPMQPTLTIPNEVAGVALSRQERTQLAQEGALPRPLLMAEKGEMIPTYLRIDPLTNTVELWRIKAEQMPNKLLGIDLTKDQQLQLVSGHAVRLSGLLDKQGEPFNATVSISPARQTLEFSDVNRIDLAVKPDREFRQQVAHNNEGAKTDLTRSREEAIGSPAINQQQAEVIGKLLSVDSPQQENSHKIRR